MKKIIAFVFLISALAFRAVEVSYSVDTKASNVHWLGKKTTGQHEGDVKLLKGTLFLDHVSPTRGEFVMDMTSITVTDITDAESNADLVGHLKNDDFFGTAKYPTATLFVKKFEKIERAQAGQANYKATAELTIKEVKNEIRFPARIDVGEEKITASANITIDRTKWNITYKSKTIFSSLGDKFIYDDINFTVHLVCNKQL